MKRYVLGIAPHRHVNKMRTLFQIILILFTIASLYIIKSDVITAYHKIQDLVNVNLPKIASYIKTPQDKKQVEITQTEQAGTENSLTVLGLKKLIDTPGALRVSNAVLSTIEESKLTRNGIITWTNNNRRDIGGLAPLKENTKLDVSAEKKLQDMFDKQYFEHVSPNGVGVSNLGDEVGYEFIVIGENLALGNFKDDQAVLTAWMNSPGHRANILNTRYTEIGVAAGRGMFEGKETWLAVQHFGLPKNACPTIDSALKEIIARAQKNITTLQLDLSKRKAAIDRGVITDGKTNAEQIDDYNKIVQDYNKLINDTKLNVEKYNQEVRAFNNCVQGTE